MLNLAAMGLVFAVIWRFPLAGYGLYLAFATPLVNVLAILVHPFLGSAGYLLTTAFLLKRRFTLKQWAHLNMTEAACLGLTLVVLFRTVQLTPIQGPTSYISPLVYASLWFPFLAVARSLGEKEMNILRELAVFGLFAIGVFSLLGFLTGDSRILMMSQLAPEGMFMDEGRFSLGDMLTKRQITIGVFNYLPYAYWLLLYSMLRKTRTTRIRTIYYGSAFVGAWTTVFISVTRSLLIEMVAGTLLVFAVFWFRRPERRLTLAIQRRKLVVAAIFLGTIIFFAASNFGKIHSAFQNRFESVGFEDHNTVVRIEDSRLALEYLLKTMPIFGAQGPSPRMNYRRVGDPSLLLVVWLYYGLIGMMLFMLTIFPAFGYLARSWHRLYIKAADPVLVACLTSWAMIHLMQMIITGCYLQPTDALFIMWFIAEVSRLRNHSKRVAPVAATRITNGRR